MSANILIFWLNLSQTRRAILISTLCIQLDGSGFPDTVNRGKLLALNTSLKKKSSQEL